LGRPTLFPATTAERSIDVLSAELDRHRATVVHPHMPVLDDDDWEALKAAFFEGPFQEAAARDLVARRRDGHSGLAGGFQEEAQVLHALATSVVPESHPRWRTMDRYLRVIRTNAQWPWDYKERAVLKLGSLLTGPDRAAERAAAGL